MRIAEWAGETELDAAIKAAVSGYADAMRRHILIETILDAWAHSLGNRSPTWSDIAYRGGLVWEILQAVGVQNYTMDFGHIKPVKRRRPPKPVKEPAQVLSLVPRADDTAPASKSPNEELNGTADPEKLE